MTAVQPNNHVDTDVSWIGRIPSNWKLRPLKHLADFFNGMAFKPEDWSTEGTPIVRIINLNGSEEFNFYASSVSTRYHVYREDILFGWSGNRGTSFGPFIWKRDGKYLLNQHIFRVNEKGCSRDWLYWCLKAVTVHVEQEAHGIIGMVHITKGKLGRVNVPVPSMLEQVAIAQFLDRETAKIDALIAKQTEFLTRLDEHRSALITDAVTRGLDTLVPRKNTEIGIEIPIAWAFVPLKRLAHSWCDGPFGSGLKSEHYADQGVRVVRLQNIGNFEFRDENRAFVTHAHFASLGGHDVQEGDLLIAGLGDEGHPVGRACVFPSGLSPAMVKADCFRIRLCSNIIIPDFVALYLSSDAARFAAALVTRGSTRDRINLAGAVALPVPVPPLEEQRRILHHVNQAKTQITAIMLKASALITVLQERRSALITAAVTGQIGIAAPGLTEAAA